MRKEHTRTCKTLQKSAAAGNRLVAVSIGPDSPVTCGCELPPLAAPPLPFGLLQGSLTFWSPVQQQPDLSLAVKCASQVVVAAEEYDTARELLVTVHEGPSGTFFDRYHAGMARVEHAILDLDRAVRLAVQLDARGTLPPHVKEALPSRNARGTISALRNRVEHADDEVSDGRWPDSLSAFLYGSRHKMEIADRSVTWVQFAGWVDAMTEAARRLLMPPTASGP
jgi:hypothetical protein